MEETMKVVMAGYQAISILHGGPSTQVLGTARYLADHGVEVEFFDPWSRFRTEGRDLFHLFAANIGTYHLAREIHGLGLPLVVSPIVYSNHAPAFVRSALRVSRLLRRAGPGVWTDYLFTADICGWASGLLPNSMAEGDLICRGYGVDPARITMVPNGVDERFASADPGLFRKSYGIENFILNVGHVGHGRKNVLNLIRALGQIDHPSVIIGRIIRGPYGDACVREAANHRQILLLGGLENQSDLLASAYAACDVFVLPSQFETPGIAALEAGLAGAKIVITPYGGPREYFGAMATYVEPSSVESIRRGIEEQMGKPKGPGLKEHIRRNYLWPAVAERTAKAYRAVLGLP
jgi:glycosyltransferase involved in cell wall biosynthesis